ncbi:Zinc finger and BTB domain-containing protein 46 [Pseudolycoriella hygida]|uniref:Zinc finger and BTB domain-containing protein 46 n=1 Tax=Pseudolycoriella hygida TaxID=35572 RepID=A0A9Q0MM28_9DIPT|nr:Zinc finger and BTB domain-containing protein 46 [Pseudolycoriella hygida]
MNFSAFASPFAGIHPFAAKFSHDAPGVFSSATNMNQDMHNNRYHSNGNNFNQISTSISNSSMQYGQNISIPYSQPQADNNNMFNIDHKNNLIKTKMERDRDEVINQQILQNVNQSWQTLANPANSVDYSSHILSATLPISIQHFLKYSETIKKESVGQPLNSGNLLGGMDHSTGFNIKSDMMGLKNGISSHGMNGMLHAGMNNHNHSLDSGNIVESAPSIPTTTKSGKKKKIKPPKVKTEKKPRPKPGEIRETKALDGSTLYCCPECQMAYPVRSLIEQHVISHAIERRFVCEICNAALKRKDHLTRHKLSHSPDRPHVCNVRVSTFRFI